MASLLAPALCLQYIMAIFISIAFETLAQNATATCPTTPSPWPSPSFYPDLATLPDPYTYLDGKSRVKSVADWYACRKPEIINFLQEYQYGYYPDHSQENVTATRSGNTLTITVTAGGKTGSFQASINLPTSGSSGGAVPVIIATGGIDNNAYLTQGIAVVTFDYTTVAADSNSKTGAFWSLYNGRDIGMPSKTPRFAFCPLFVQSVEHGYVSKADCSCLTLSCRCSHRLGLGLPPCTRCSDPQSSRNRFHKGGRHWLLSSREGGACRRSLR